MVDVEAANRRILELLLGVGNEFERMDPILQKRLLKVLNLLIAADSLQDVAMLRSLNLKQYNEFFQVNVDGDKRLWFQLGESGIVVHEFGEGNH